MLKNSTMKYIFIALVLLSITSQSFAQDRSKDPIVLRGVAIPCMAGIAPDSIVAFRFNGNWEQIPVQIDEIAVKEIKTPYGIYDCVDRSSENINWEVEFYVDDNTYTGLDDNPTFDDNDELVFMAKDTGKKLDTNQCPNGVKTNTQCEITVRDPLTNLIWGYVYLFQQDGSLQQSAGKQYVQYEYSYEEDYKTAYQICVFSGTNNNPEKSVVSTSEYEIGFSQRSVEDLLRIKAGNANQKDILDRHQIFINENTCSRNEQIFSDGKGVIVTNKVGPVRAIRSVMGAASGTFTEKIVRFTQYRADYTIHYRLHTANGYSDIFDFNEAALGMTYHNNRNPQAVVIDGIQDELDISQPNTWELITGEQGSLVTTFAYQTDINIGTEQAYQAGIVEGTVLSYYSDAGNNARYTCTGDGKQFGSTGITLATKQCTDFRAAFDVYPECQPQYVKSFTQQRIHYYLPPYTTTNEAEKYGLYGLNSLTGNGLSLISCNASTGTCEDGIKNGDETGIDCGGSNCSPCRPVPSCNDGILNGDESDIDCGGSTCPICKNICDTPANFSVKDITNSTATLQWSSSHNSKGYQVEFKKANSNNWKLRFAMDTSFTLTGLKKNKTYEWRVKSDCGDTTSNWSAVQSFKTNTDEILATCSDGIQNGAETGIDCGGTCHTCCTAPNDLIATDIQENRAALSWNGSDEAISYTIQIKLPFSFNEAEKTVFTNSSLIRPLTPNTNYEWRVRANCAADTSVWSIPSTFRTSSSINNIAINSTNSSTDNVRLELYPVPVSQSFTVKSNQPMLQIWITDVAGKILHQQQLGTFPYSIELNAVHFPSGYYFIKVQTDKSSTTKQLIKQ